MGIFNYLNPLCMLLSYTLCTQLGPHSSHETCSRIQRVVSTAVDKAGTQGTRKRGGVDVCMKAPQLSVVYCHTVYTYNWVRPFARTPCVYSFYSYVSLFAFYPLLPLLPSHCCRPDNLL